MSMPLWCIPEYHLLDKNRSGPCCPYTLKVSGFFHSGQEERSQELWNVLVA